MVTRGSMSMTKHWYDCLYAGIGNTLRNTLPSLGVKIRVGVSEIGVSLKGDITPLHINIVRGFIEGFGPYKFDRITNTPHRLTSLVFVNKEWGEEV